MAAPGYRAGHGVFWAGWSATGSRLLQVRFVAPDLCSCFGGMPLEVFVSHFSFHIYASGGSLRCHEGSILGCYHSSARELLGPMCSLEVSCLVGGTPPAETLIFASSSSLEDIEGAFVDLAGVPIGQLRFEAPPGFRLTAATVTRTLASYCNSVDPGCAR